MRILVTGSTGRVGANLVVALLESGHSVRAFIYPGDASRMRKLDAYNVERMEGDLRDSQDVARAVSGMEAIYHLGGAMGAPIGTLDYFDINARGTLNVLEAAKSEDRLQKFIYASTDAVYPTDHKTSRYPEIITEETDIQPDMPYAMSKWIGEALCLRYQQQYGLPVVPLRFACVVGPGELLERGIAARGMWLDRMLEYLRRTSTPAPEVNEARARLEAVWTGEEQLLLARDAYGVPAKLAVVDIRDLIQWLLAALEREEAIGQVINVPGPEPARWEMAVPMASEKLGIPYVDVSLPLGPPYLYHCEISYERARRLLGYEPQHGNGSMVDLSIALRRGEDIGLILTGVPYGPAG
jgi:nucleoside-diphosphate-sugar epimerase